MERKRLWPFTLTAAVIFLDQITKAVIVSNWPQQGSFIKDVFNNDILWIIHVRNKAIAFSIGEGISDSLRPILFVIFPVAALVLLVVFYMKTNEFSALQRWALAGIVGGGVGNIIDRIFRPDGVVDFISIKFYGIFGLSRWPTFNMADSSVVICGIIFIITVLLNNPKGYNSWKEYKRLKNHYNSKDNSRQNDNRALMDNNSPEDDTRVL